jgi:hypothetical protein
MQLRAMLLLLAVAVGCTDVQPPSGQCRYDSDCAEGAVCAGTYCRTGCVTDRDCAAGQRCGESDRFGVLTCQAVVARAQCARTSDCPDGLVCLDNVCRPQCQQDYDCQVINPFFRCVANACTLRCAAGAGDCDGDPRNGCEADLASDLRHCLACGTACAGAPGADAVCAPTGCATRCRAGFADCDGRAANGCEVELAADASHCGACGRACAVANGQGRCAAGVCGRERCNAGFDDCDGDPANGCEARIDSAAHCGRCGSACTVNMVCTAGACASSCAAGTTLCGLSCVDTATSAIDCGRCSNACPAAPNAAPACVAGACDVTCNPGFARTAAGCTAIPAPRLVSPPSLATLNGNRDALFEVALATGTDGAVVELCGDRACATVLERFTGTGVRVTRGGALAAGVYFWRAYGRVGANAGLSPSTQTWEVRVPARAATGDAAWGTMLDVNADGYTDVAVGEARSQRVLVYAGGASGLPARPTTTLTVMAAESSFGQRLAAGDFNGDGFADLAATAPDANAVYVFSGSAAGLGATGVARTRTVFGTYGTGLAAASDLNHDGYADLLVGFSCFKGCSPGVDVYLGGAAGIAATPITLTSPDRFADFGSEIAALGRVATASPYESFVVMLRSKGGSEALVYRGTATGVESAAHQTFPMNGGGGQAGPAGDVNGDGFADLAIANHAASGAAQVGVYLGSATGFGTTTMAVSEGENIGGSLSPVGDVNGDGFGDLVAGNGFSSARVFLGSATGRMTLGPVLTAPAAPTGMEGYGRFSEALGFVGDLNRDGFDDILVGAPDDGDTWCSGEVFLFQGRAAVTAPLVPALILTVPDARCGGAFGGAIASFARPSGRACRT